MGLLLFHLTSVKIPKSKPLNEVIIRQTIDIPDLPGWKAFRYDEKIPGGNAWWSIDDEKGIYVGAIFDNGLLTITLTGYSSNNHKDLIDNPIQAARYIYLKMKPFQSRTNS